MSIPGYDAWKLATPPEYEITPEEERAMEDARAALRQEFRENVECAIHEERGDLTFEEVLRVLNTIATELPRWP